MADGAPWNYRFKLKTKTASILRAVRSIRETRGYAVRHHMVRGDGQLPGDLWDGLGVLFTLSSNLYVVNEAEAFICQIIW